MRSPFDVVQRNETRPDKNPMFFGSCFFFSYPDLSDYYMRQALFSGWCYISYVIYVQLVISGPICSLLASSVEITLMVGNQLLLREPDGAICRQAVAFSVRVLFPFWPKVFGSGGIRTLGLTHNSPVRYPLGHHSPP